MSVDRSVLEDTEAGEEVSLDELPDWQKPELEIARAIVEDPGKRFVDVPKKSDFHEYRHMERFIGRLDDTDAAEQLWRAIKGKGAFRFFRDTAGRLGLLERWYRHRDDAMKEFVVGWAEARGIPFEDDVISKPAPNTHPRSP